MRDQSVVRGIGKLLTAFWLGKHCFVSSVTDLFLYYFLFLTLNMTACNDLPPLFRAEKNCWRVRIFPCCACHSVGLGWAIFMLPPALQGIFLIFPLIFPGMRGVWLSLHAVNFLWVEQEKMQVSDLHNGGLRSVGICFGRWIIFFQLSWLFQLIPVRFCSLLWVGSGCFSWCAGLLWI